MNKRVKSCAWIFLAAFLVLGLVGCGKKAPPLMPLDVVEPLAIPGNLTPKVVDRSVHLTWTYSKPSGSKLLPLYFEVSAAQRTQDDCEGCPMVFETLGKVDMPFMKFSMELAPEVSYYFRVQAVGENQLRGDYSKPVKVVLP